MEHDKEAQMVAVVLHGLTEELLRLRAQVTALQAGQTAQLIAARRAAFERAAEECEAFAREVDDSDLDRGAFRCADVIRALKGKC